ncbi:hypothetical protein DR864_04725 [Runella rosea]|uniref:Uncharacterized protein n=1 Tax=Runella rosea TaxID=2259595 RepID=A0A344TEL6_9BACT|nr:hypothetical protein [Runella rosea]AXE17087.1 hypothetical protein DR864_04725 [Runella rosea]
MKKIPIGILLLLFAFSCVKKSEEVVPLKPSLVGKWTIKSAKNLSATTLTAKANATIEFTDTKYTVSQTQPFANYKNTANLTEYLRFTSNSTYKLLPIDEIQPLVEADLKLFFGNNIPNASKNIAAVIALYKKEGINYVAIINGATIVTTNTAGGTETTDIPAFGIVNFTENGFTFEEISFGDIFLINDAKYVPQLPAANIRAQILLEK